MASFEQQLADALIIAFDELGGEPFDAVRNALYHRNVDGWLQQETTKIAVAGGAEMAIPGLHMLTIPAGMTYLLHKMAHISWGVGALKGAYVTETIHASDLRNILTIWANGNDYNASLLDAQAIQIEAVRHALAPEGYDALRAIALDTTRQDPTIRTAQVLLHIVETFPYDEKAQRAYKHALGKEALAEALQHAEGRTTMTPFAEEGIDLPERRIGSRLALKLAAQLSLRVPARWIMGFVPIAGAIANAFFNAQTLRSMADAAVIYYDRALTLEQITHTIGDTQ